MEMQLTMSLTALVVYICILTLALYDLTVVVFKGTTSSISQFLIRTSLKSPLINGAFFASIGHLWFIMYPIDCHFDWVERMVVAGCGAVFGAVAVVVVHQVVWGLRCQD